jgi:hypothetical protein
MFQLTANFTLARHNEYFTLSDESWSCKLHLVILNRRANRMTSRSVPMTNSGSRVAVYRNKSNKLLCVGLTQYWVFLDNSSNYVYY